MGERTRKLIMIDEKRLNEFVNYDYKPFSKKECIKRIVLIWILSMALCFLGHKNAIWFISLFVINTFITIGFVYLLLKKSKEKSSRFLCDGTAYLYYSVILNLAAYRFITLWSDSNIFLAISFLAILPICIILFLFLVYRNIKKDRYNKKKIAVVACGLPISGAVLGFAVARIFVKDVDQASAILFVAIGLVFLSVLMSIGSLNFLKFGLLYKIKGDT